MSKSVPLGSLLAVKEMDGNQTVWEMSGKEKQFHEEKRYIPRNLFIFRPALMGSRKNSAAIGKEIDKKGIVDVVGVVAAIAGCLLA